VPAGSFGIAQTIEISPVSGMSNVKFWLEAHGYDPANDRHAQALFAAAKRTDRALTEAECRALLSGVQV
jgi:hypothetical protein